MKSMTGFGKAVISEGNRELCVEMRAVNHRYLDISLKMPRLFQVSEDKVRKILSGFFSRGHLDVYVSYTDRREGKQTVQVDLPLAGAWVQAAAELSAATGLPNDFTVTALMKSPDVVTILAAEDEQEVLDALLCRAAQQAAQQLDLMRCYEGEKLKNDLLEKLSLVNETVAAMKTLAPAVSEDYAKKLRQRIFEALSDVSVDEARLLNEVAFFADKSNIDEELARLCVHSGHFVEIAASTEPSGRKLDFLIQEFNREANTACSKSNHAELTALGLRLKNDIEKMREQVQNVE